MPSRAWSLTLAALMVAIFGYSAVVAQQILMGVFLVALVYLFGWLAQKLSADGIGTAFNRVRAVVTGVVVGGVLGYAALVVQELLFGVVVAGTVFLTSWVTSPNGPVARYLTE